MGDVAPEPKVDGMARFFVPRNNIEDQHGVITGAELDHVRKVLRLRPGDQVTLFDDAGWEHEAVVESYGAGRGTFEILKSYGRTANLR